MMKQEGKKFVQQNSRTNQRESMRGQKAVNKQLIRESNRFVSDEMLHWNCGGEWWKITNMMENEESMKIDEEISAEWIGLWCPSIKREKRRSGRNDRPMNPRRYNKITRQEKMNSGTRGWFNQLCSIRSEGLFTGLNEFRGFTNHMFWLSRWGASAERWINEWTGSGKSEYCDKAKNRKETKKRTELREKLARGERRRDRLKWIAQRKREKRKGRQKDISTKMEKGRGDGKRGVERRPCSLQKQKQIQKLLTERFND